MSIPRIRVTIDALVLRGFEPGQRAGIAAGVQQELHALFTGPNGVASLDRDRSRGTLRAGAIQTAPGATPQTIGAQAARALIKAVRS